jgi:hypothetical protein
MADIFSPVRPSGHLGMVRPSSTKTKQPARVTIAPSIQNIRDNPMLCVFRNTAEAELKMPTPAKALHLFGFCLGNAKKHTNHSIKYQTDSRIVSHAYSFFWKLRNDLGGVLLCVLKLPQVVGVQVRVPFCVKLRIVNYHACMILAGRVGHVELLASIVVVLKRGVYGIVSDGLNIGPYSCKSIAENRRKRLISELSEVLKSKEVEEPYKHLNLRLAPLRNGVLHVKSS